jgi:hypothetical protein
MKVLADWLSGRKSAFNICDVKIGRLINCFYQLNGVLNKNIATSVDYEVHLRQKILEIVLKVVWPYKH